MQIGEPPYATASIVSRNSTISSEYGCAPMPHSHYSSVADLPVPDYNQAQWVGIDTLEADVANRV